MDRVALASLGLLLGTQTCLGQKTAESVCQILENLNDYAGQMVSVRAKIESDVDDWLAAEKDCRADFKVGGRKFRNVIALAWPSDPVLALEKREVPFSTDRASNRLLKTALGRPHLRIYAPVEGLVVTRAPAYAAVGFGHMGIAPVQLVVKRISGIELTYRKDDGSEATLAIGPSPPVPKP
jgi:hypothetical protein